MPWLRFRRSLRFIVGDQHNSTSTTRELGFGPRTSTVPSPASLSARRNHQVVALSPRTGRLAHNHNLLRPHWTVNLEQIQRKSRVREITPENSPRTRAGVEKKDQKAELKKNQTRRCYVEKTSIFPPDDRQTPARCKTRNHRSEDAKMLGPPPCGPQCTGRADQRDARGDANRDRSTQNYRRPVLLCATQRYREAHKQRNNNNNHDETPRAARPPPDRSDSRPRGLGASLIERR